MRLFSVRFATEPFDISARGEGEIDMWILQTCFHQKASLRRLLGHTAMTVVLSATLLAQPNTRSTKAALPQPEAAQEAHLTVKTEVVSLAVSVTDQQGRFLPGLAKEDFRVVDDRVSQEISYFSDTDAPATVGIVFDVSGSMSAGKIAHAREALAQFIQTSHPDDEYFLIGFSNQAEILLDHTSDSEALLRKVSALRPQGDTVLYDGVRLALHQVAQGNHTKRALIVISDGEDNHSRTTFNQLRRQLQEANVTVWTVLIGPLPPRSNGGAVMDKLASVSGGKAFFPRNAEKMGEDFAQIALELRRQYSIGYTPSNLVADGRWHRVKVEVEPFAAAARVVVRTRQGYYAGLPSTNLSSLMVASGMPQESQVGVPDCCLSEGRVAACLKGENLSRGVCE
jgi:Ca-activated chloride channel family protein